MLGDLKTEPEKRSVAYKEFDKRFGAITKFWSQISTELYFIKNVCVNSLPVMNSLFQMSFYFLKCSRNV